MARLNFCICALTIVALVASCAAPVENTARASAEGPTMTATRQSVPTPVFLRQRQNELVPSVGSTARGALALSAEGCIYLQTATESWLIIWPPETTLSGDGEAITLTDSSGAIISIGDEIELGGTGSQPPTVSTIGGVAIPESCRSMNAFLTNALGVRKI